MRRLLFGGTLKVCDIFRCLIILLTRQVEKSTHEVFPSINCQSNWDLARHWYEMCNTSHTCTLTTVRSRPTRLIQLGAMHDISVRLRESPFTPQDVEYCTLSHCWGSIPMLTLSRS